MSAAVISRLSKPAAKPSYAPWASASHDAGHSGTSPYAGPESGRILWRRKLGGDVTPGPAVGRDGTIYAAGNGGVLHALDARGRELWSFDGGGSYGGDLSTTPAVTRNGVILWPGPANTLYALDGNGALLWKKAFGSFVLSPAIRPEGTVFVVEMSGALHALDVDRSRGRELWSAELGGTSYGSPAVGRDAVYTTAGHSLVAVAINRPKPGVDWRFEVGGELIEVSPSLAPDGTVLIGTNDGSFYSVSAEGEQRWKLPIGDLSYSSPVVTPSGIAYMGDHGGGVSIVDAATGGLLERLQGQQATQAEKSVGVWTAPLIDARGNVYFGTRPGHIYGFGADGRRLFDLATPGTVDSYPALSGDGTLLVGSTDGYLYAIGD